jgi:anti-sigma-K factor RskA
VTSREHERLHEDVGAYLLGALDETESAAFARHASRCEECASELKRLRVAVDALPRSVAPLDPPPELKAGLMESVHADAAPRIAPAPRRRRAWLPRLRPAAAWVSAALLLAIGVAAGYGYGALMPSGGEDVAARTIDAQVDRSRLPAGSARLVVARGEGARPVLSVQDVPQPAGDDVYQVWVLRGTRPVPAGLFAVTRDGAGAAVVEADLSGAHAVLITREPKGGSPQPTEKPLMSFALS